MLWYAPGMYAYTLADGIGNAIQYAKCTATTSAWRYVWCYPLEPDDLFLYTHTMIPFLDLNSGASYTEPDHEMYS